MLEGSEKRGGTEDFINNKRKVGENWREMKRRVEEKNWRKTLE